MGIKLDLAVKIVDPVPIYAQFSFVFFAGEENQFTQIRACFQIYAVHKSKIF